MVTATKNTVENKISIHLTLNDFIVHSLDNALSLLHSWHLYCAAAVTSNYNGKNSHGGPWRQQETILGYHVCTYLS